MDIQSASWESWDTLGMSLLIAIFHIVNIHQLIAGVLETSNRKEIELVRPTTFLGTLSFLYIIGRESGWAELLPVRFR